MCESRDMSPPPAARGGRARRPPGGGLHPQAPPRPLPHACAGVGLVRGHAPPPPRRRAHQAQPRRDAGAMRWCRCRRGMPVDRAEAGKSVPREVRPHSRVP
jgi:hypothetical protein